MEYKIPFYRPSSLIGIETINQNIDSICQDSINNLTNHFLEKINYSYALAVPNLSLATHLSFCAIDLKRGDKVITPINSYVATPHSIRFFDSEPIFIDINLRTYHINIDSLKSAIAQNKSKKLRAIVVKHFAGLAQDITPILEIAKENNLLVIEDFSDFIAIDKINLQSDIAIFSLNFPLDKVLQGAIIVFKDEKTYNRAKLLSNNAIVPSNEVKYLYDVLDVGCDYTIDGIKAYFLDKLMQKRKNFLSKRLEVAKRYFKELANTPHITLPIEDKNHQYGFFIIEIDKNRDSFAKELKALGIEVGLHYIPLNFTTYYKQKYNLKVFSFPNALTIYQKILSLPCNSKLTQKEVDYIINSVKKVAQAHV